jgi:hypothetical protein
VEILCVIGGLGLMAYGVWGVVRAWRLRRDGVSVQGRVARIADDSEGGQRATVEFWAQGRTRRITSRHGAFSSVTVGTSVPIRYAESKPDRAVIDTTPGAFRAPVGSTLSGFFLATIWFVPYFSLLP